MPSNARAPLVFSIDSGDGGRPDLRAQLTLKRGSGDLVKWEPFSANNAGRRLRSWIRFSHTGEAGGIPGETIAAVASLGACFLVWTGISLALRRLWGHRPPPQCQSGRRTEPDRFLPVPASRSRLSKIPHPLVHTLDVRMAPGARARKSQESQDREPESLKENH